MENQVVKVLNKEHGKKVIQYWKDRGVDTGDCDGSCNESDGYRNIYYGVINNRFSNWNLSQVQLYKAEIIELPNEEKDTPSLQEHILCDRPKEENEPIFKVGDKVYDYTYGWGEVVDISESENDKHPIQVDFLNDMTEYYNNKGSLFNKTNIKTLSFTKYTLQGFSQERPIELPKVGELCLFYDHEEDLEVGDLFCGKFQAYKKVEKYPYKANDNSSWANFKRIKILD